MRRTYGIATTPGLVTLNADEYEMEVESLDEDVGGSYEDAPDDRSEISVSDDE